MNIKFIAERIAHLRISKGLSARRLSYILPNCDSPNYINNIENGKRNLSMVMFLAICECLEVSPRDFFNSGVSPSDLLADRLASKMRLLDEKTLTHILGIVEELLKAKYGAQQ